jgi:tripartite-type tricarboxylate transporter receptor subunit TctC
MRTSVFRMATSALLCAAVVFSASGWAAEKYPDRPIKLVVAWNAGSSQDVPQRIAAEYVKKHLGVPIVVTNTPGASGMTGTREVVKNAKPDGYTLLSSADSTWYPIFTGLTDYGIDEFVYVANLLKQTLVATVRADAPWKDMQELAQYAKQNPDKVRWAMTVGNQSHFIPLNIEKLTGAKFKFVAIPGGDTQRQAALLAGNVDVLLTYMTSIDEYVKAKKAKLLGVTYPERLPTHPDVPTIKEQGIGVVYEFRVGLEAPKGTPPDRVKIIADAYGKVSKDPEYVKKMTDLGFSIDYMGPEQKKKWMDTFSVSLKEYAKEAGYQVKK